MGLLNPHTIWVLIPLAAIIGSFIIKWRRTDAQIALQRADDTALQEIRASLQRLEVRVANLERAVMTAESDRRYAL
jgi:hypothetical protein